MTTPSPAARGPISGLEQGILRAHRPRWAELLPWAIAIAVFFLFPGYRVLATQILVLILFAVSLDLLVGYAGIVSLGHTALFGTGAYVAAILASDPQIGGVSVGLGWGEPLSAVALGALIAALVGLVTGWVILRTHGLTLLMLTLAFTIMLHEAANDFDGITGGFDGINFSNDKILGTFAFDPVWYGVNYWYAFAVLLLGFIVARVIVYSAFGRSLVGIRENTRRMHAIGTPVHWRMVTIYAISAALAGAAGAVWVQIQGNVTTAVYSFELAGDVLIMVILGGTGRLYGAVVGTIVFKLLESLTEQILGTNEPYWQFVIGVVLVLTVLFARRGLFGIFEDLTPYWRRRIYLVGAVGAVLVVVGRLFGASINEWFAGPDGEPVFSLTRLAWILLAAIFVLSSWRGLLSGCTEAIARVAHKSGISRNSDADALARDDKVA